MKKIIFFTVANILASSSFALSSPQPSRLMLSGTGEAVFRLRAINETKTPDVLEVNVFYNESGVAFNEHTKEVDFMANPLKFRVGPESSRPFRVRFDAAKAGVYFICTKSSQEGEMETPDGKKVTFVGQTCARVYAGVKP